MDDIKLTLKQKKFVDAYLGQARGNATEAARLAGYAGSDETLRAVGYENLTKPHIAQVVSERVAELAMAPAEVLARIADIANGTVADFIDVERWGAPRLDVPKAAQAGKLNLIKKVSVTQWGVDFELYDRMDALKTLAKYHGLLVDRIKSDVKAEVDVTDANGAKAYLLALVEKATPASAEGSDRGAD
jgi:phage terminase small subunit